MLWPTLGAVRFFLALIVAASHFWLYFPVFSNLLVLRYLCAPIAVFGFLFVSGYSIAASLAKQRRGFYWRRALRIVPLYWILIPLSSYLPFFFGGDILLLNGSKIIVPPIRELLGNLFFLQGFAVGSIPANGVVWSLSIEIFFYAIAPFIVRVSQATLGLLVTALAVGFVLSASLHLPYYSEILHGGSVLLLGWCWLLGFWVYRAESCSQVLVAQCFGSVIIALNGTYVTHLWPVTWTIAVAGIEAGKQLPDLRYVAGFFSWLGDISYPFYIAHEPVFFLLYGMHCPLSPSLYFLVAILVSAVLDRFVDRPIKRRLVAFCCSEKRRIAS